MVENSIREVEITVCKICNLRCRMCEFWQEKPLDKPLTTSELLLAISNLNSWLKKPFKITFSGGEPFMRKDILALVRFASNLGIGTHLTTNGTMITPALAKEICSSGLSTIAISIDSLDAGVHDYMRGVPGSLDLTLNGVRELSKSEKHPGIVIASIVSGFNHESLPELLSWVSDENIGGLIIQPLSEVFLKQGERDKRVWAHSDAVIGTIDKLTQMKKEGYPLLNELSQLEGMKECFR